MHTINQYTDFFDKNFTEFMVDDFASANSIGKMLCREKDADAIVTQISELAGLGLATDTGFYDNPAIDEPIQGYDSKVTMKKWTQSVKIPKAVWLPLMKRKGERQAVEYLVNQYRDEGMLSEITRSFYDRIDEIVAGKINLGTSTTLAPDGVALFHVSHPVNPSLPTTYNANTTSGQSLSIDKLEDLLELAGKCSDRRNQPANLTTRYPFFLMAPPELQGVSIRLTKSLGIPGSGNNDINAVKQMGLQDTPIIWPRLSTRYDGNGSLTNWFLAVPGQTFSIYWMENISRRSWVDPLNETYHFMAEAWFNVHVNDFRGMWKN